MEKEGEAKGVELQWGGWVREECRRFSLEQILLDSFFLALLVEREADLGQSASEEMRCLVPSQAVVVDSIGVKVGGVRPSAPIAISSLPQVNRESKGAKGPERRSNPNSSQEGLH